MRHRLDGCAYAVKKIRNEIKKVNAAALTEVHALAALQGCPHVIR